MKRQRDAGPTSAKGSLVAAPSAHRARRRLLKHFVDGRESSLMEEGQPLGLPLRVR